ncbi:shootin-1 [Anopheles aquasalis]|uniref:shootin-1 n=1 Tax=Anopheles aquasalis TaxID=42839 RepID=UPI00215A9254|nr:shootin-1 [Anopheles aquasalis]
MDTSPPSRRSSIPIPKRKTSLHLYMAGSSSTSSSNVGSASASMNEDEPSFTRSIMLGSFIQSPSAGSGSASPPSAAAAGHNTTTCELKESHNRLMEKCEKLMKRNEQLQQANDQLTLTVQQLIANAESSKRELAEFTEKNRRLRRKLSEIIPGESSTVADGGGAAESDDDAPPTSEPDGDSSAKPVRPKEELAGPQTTEGDWLNEIEKLKSYQNNVDLQLYEANEKISDLLESKQQHEEIIEKLRAENAELSKVARLMSRNMLESIDTTKSLGNSLMQVRRERDMVRDMVRQSRDSVDSKTSTNEEIQKLRSEYELQRKTYEAQFIEYKSLMNEEHERKTNDQIVVLELEVERLRQQLEETVCRAERAEEEVQSLRQQIRISRHQERQSSSLSTAVGVLPVLDGGGALDGDSLPPVSLMCQCAANRRSTAGSSVSSAPQQAVPVPPPAPSLPPPPPPPPPPPLLLPAANKPANSKHLISSEGATISTETPKLGLSEAISMQKLNHVAITNVNSHPAATGIDSVIADIKSGRVTLRKRRPNVLNKPACDADAADDGSNRDSIRDGAPNYRQLAARNPALKEMYEILDRMKRQNRKSKIIVESEFTSSSPFSGSSGEATANCGESSNTSEIKVRAGRILTDVVDC